MKKIAIYGAGIMMLVVGALHLVAPQMMMKDPGIELTSTNHFHIIRAAYGGAYIGMGILFLLGALNAKYQRSSLIAIAILFFSFAAGRIVSIAVDGIPAALYLGVLAAELFFGILAFLSLRSKTD